jgi:molybdenum cofactor biosynthesis enzyme MoaA
VATIYNKIRDHFSVNTLSITEACPLNCSFCKIWQKEETFDVEDQDLTFWLRNFEVAKLKTRKVDFQLMLLDLVKKDQFFNYFKYEKKFNIIGGEPTLFWGLKQILAYLKNKGVKIIFWTNGVFDFKEIESDLPYLDQIMFFLPSVQANEYVEITGFDYLDLALTNLDQFLAAEKEVKINFPIQPSTIQNSPFLTDFIEEKKLPLVISYNLQQEFSRESIDYITRYNRVKGIKVVRSRKLISKNCACFPIPGVVDFI